MATIAVVLVLVVVVVALVGGIIAYAMWPSKKKEDPKPTPTPTPPTPPKPSPGGNGEANGENSGKANGGGRDGCAWDEYLAQDNNDIPHCKEEGCRLKDTTVEECKAACCDDALCVAVQWRDDGRCLLKHTVGTIRGASNDKTLYVKKPLENS